MILICNNIICKITNYLHIDEKSQLQRVHKIFELNIDYQELFTNNLINKANKIINNLKNIIEYFNFIELYDLKFIEINSYQSYLFKINSKYIQMKKYLENTKIYPYIENTKIKCFNEIKELIKNDKILTIKEKYNRLQKIYNILTKYCIIYYNECDNYFAIENNNSDSDSDSDSDRDRNSYSDGDSNSDNNELI